MSTTTTGVPTELTAWMRARLALIHRQAEAKLGGVPELGRTVVLAPLGLTWSAPGTPGDDTCDRCSAHCGEPDTLVLVAIAPVEWLRVCGGLCVRCAEAEGVKW